LKEEVLAIGELAQPTETSSFIAWWLIEQPKYFWHATVALTKKTIVFFSIPTLAGTLFAPWKRDVQRTSNLPIDLALRGVWDNILSRFIGFIIRSITILIAGGATLACLVGGIIIIIFWTLLPLFIVLIIWSGVKL
jgi:hypothetical protein